MNWGRLARDIHPIRGRSRGLATGFDLVTPEQLKSADAVWLVSSMRLAAPVRAIDGQPFVIDDGFTAALNAHLLALRD